VNADEHEAVVEVFPENFPDWALTREQRERYGRERPDEEPESGPEPSGPAIRGAR
jgi:hypothetical protein